MSHADFVHLRVHSAYSLSEGALKIPDIASLCKANRMPAVAITDTNNLFGALEFSQTCAKAGIQPIVGCQLAVAFETPEPNRTHRNSFDELVLLAQNEAGYGNLLKLTSQAFLAVEAGASPHVPGDAVKAHAEGLIALTGGLRGPLGRYLAAGQGDAAEAVCDRLKAIFGDRLYIEISRQGVREETAIEPKLLALADAMNLPLVATNEAFFAEEGMYAAHDTLLCIAAGTSVNEPERRRLTPEFRFKTAQEMRAQFADVPEALDNTLVIAGRCAVMAETRAPILPHFVSEAGRSEIDELRHRATEGLEKRLADHVLSGSGTEEERAAAAAPYRERLDFELGVIESMGYPGYFLIVAEFHPMGQGRGHPGWAGPRLRRRLRCRLGADDHRSRPAALGLAVRTLPQSGARVDAGLRHRFLPGTAGRGDPLRSAEIRRRPGGADHHLRQAAGPRGIARRRPRAADALRPDRPAVQAGAETIRPIR